MKHHLSKSPDRDSDFVHDGRLDQALNDFRSSVHAWSEYAYSRPHLPARVYHTSWRMAVAWALGCVLVSGSVAGGLYERHHKQEVARTAAADAAHQQELAEQQRAQNVLKQNEDLLAKVDSDVSRSVPSAMEPLAQLMGDDEVQ